MHQFSTVIKYNMKSRDVCSECINETGKKCSISVPDFFFGFMKIIKFFNLILL